MRIAQITNHFWPCIGGIEKVVMELSKGLLKEGHEVKVVCLNKCPYSCENLKQKDKVEGIEVERIPFIDLKYYKVAASVLEKIKDCDVLHIHGIGFFSDFLLITKFIHKKPIVISTHGGIFHTRSILPLKWVYFNILQRFLLINADAIVAVSRNDKKLFDRISKKVVLIENGADVDKLLALGKKKENNSFLFVGRLSRNKRVDLLLEVFSEVVRNLPDAKLCIAGEDWEGLAENLKLKAKELGLEKKVFFLGKISETELLGYYDKSEFFVSASEYEGFGITLVEAMAAGCIPLVNDIESFRNIIENGKEGFLLKMKDAKNAAAKIAEVAKDEKLKARLRENSRKSCIVFSWNGKIKNYLEIYARAKKAFNQKQFSEPFLK